MAGDMPEWNLDWFAPYVNPCRDCAMLTDSSGRVLRGGNAGDFASDLPPTLRNDSTPTVRDYLFGVRCARTP
jgi:formylglycine-generating enzyme required for sulfatase activity